MAVVLAALILAAVAVAVLLTARARRRARRAPPLAVPAVHETKVAGGRVALTLEIDAVDPSAGSVRRLFEEATVNVLSSNAEAQEVEVRDMHGRVLGRVSRGGPPRPAVSLPPFLSEPHAPLHRGPDLSGHLAEDEPFAPPRPEGPIEAASAAPGWAEQPGRPLVEHFDLPARVRDLVRDPDDPVDLVRAILEAGGVPAEVDGDLVRARECSMVVVAPARGSVITAEMLNHAFLRVHGTATERRLVVGFGCFDSWDVRRREIHAPDVRHVGPRAVQRMADAVALGVDPLRSVLGPPLVAAP
jgi:hypothetical protein